MLSTFVSLRPALQSSIFSGIQFPRFDSTVEETSASISDELAACQQELADTKNQLLRSIADQRNAAQRNREALAEAKQEGAIKVLKNMLEVADNLDRAFESIPPQIAKGKKVPAKTAKIFADGVGTTQRQMKAALERLGVRRVESLGSLFDPSTQHALSIIKDPSKKDGEVLAVVAEGYEMEVGGEKRVVREAKVVVNRLD
ncbi:GrpE nucleotide exchange factor [Carpediemonas membranifera]|uniref:GrpE nucleotide exchange factor n=1 Tax=Carpediemonas membranifera TaxID=201153 RepID=A0A8J6E3D5_9EUKA|nr:GrpE nucleotide exchange factor [Carpediemonas membranifera]|eukprot:KAG9393007.1 GrpE nucleotide exchange factor [Carpediemonas membranifera]